jgi:hypothetical protein
VTPITPTPPDFDVAGRAASTLELWAKMAGAGLIVWGFLERVAKPYFTWRREAQGRMIREILKPELDQLRNMREEEDGCARRMEHVLRQLKELFGDHDGLYLVALDNRERLDETNGLLDSMGFSSAARHPDRSAYIKEIVERLGERRKARRRNTDPIP